MRHELKNQKLYKKTKNELAKMCTENKINVNGTTKVDIALALLQHEGIDTKQFKTSTSFQYNGDLSKIPVLSSQVRDLGIASLKTILQHHNLPTQKNKDQLVLDVCLLRSGRKHVINKEKKLSLSKLIEVAESIMSHQRSLNVVLPPSRKRRHSTPTQSILSSKSPRAMASAYPIYTESKIELPPNITKLSMASILKPLKEDIQASLRPDDNEISPSVNISPVNTSISDEYEAFFEIGAKVAVRWKKDQGWKSGWFVAFVQDYDMMNDWIKVEYASEEGHLYKIEVSQYLESKDLKLKSGVFSK
ncbi:uncharacterized protein [Clytia hemisphaerica]|uniref:uncharacterized protein n=1 Tax=Clytia hemisphaerica TaxID=252671 RepID=UPI0034D3E103